MKNFGFDVETNRNFGRKNSLRSLQLYNPETKKVSVFHRSKDDSEFYLSMVSKDWKVERTGKIITRTRLVEFFSSKENGCVPHNGYFDQYVVLRDLGVLPHVTGDSFVLSMLIPSPGRVSRSLDNQMKRVIDPAYDKHKWGKWEDFDWDAELPDQAILYAAQDAYASFVLECRLRKEYPRYNNKAYQVEIELMPLISQMRTYGLLRDGDAWTTQLGFASNERTRLLDEITKLRGSPLNPSSPKAVADWLFVEKGFKPTVFTDKGSPSTARFALEEIDEPEVELLLETRDAMSLASSLADTSQWHLSESDTVIHPELKPMSHSGTSRILTDNPNFQTWKNVMFEAVVPRPGTKFVFCELKQFETATLLFLSKDEAAAFYEKDESIFKMIGNDFKSIPTCWLTRLCFLWMTANPVPRQWKKEMRDLGIGAEIPKLLWEHFPRLFPRLDMMISNAVDKANRSGVTGTFLGRHQRLDVYGTEKMRDLATKRYILTSCAADVLKLMILNLSRMNHGLRMVLPLFDGFMFEVEESLSKEEVVARIAPVMALDFDATRRNYKFEVRLGKTMGSVLG